jgi:hypothetical protein
LNKIEVEYWALQEAEYTNENAQRIKKLDGDIENRRK